MKNYTNMAHKYQAANLLLLFSDELSKSVYQRRIVEEKLVLNMLLRQDNGSTTLATKDLFYTSVTRKTFAGLTKITRLYILEYILDEMCMFNLLWKRPDNATENSQHRKILKELVDAKLLFPTEVTGIYLVNPLKLFRGNPITSVEATRELLKSNGNRPDAKLIKDLRPGDKYVLKNTEDQFNLLSNGFTPNMLEEPDMPYGL